MTIHSELNNGLAVETAFEDLQSCAENMIKAVEDIMTMSIDDQSYAFFEKLLEPLEEINSIDTKIEYPRDSKTDFMSEIVISGLPL